MRVGRPLGRGLFTTLVLLAVWAALPVSAHAVYPGTNGKLSFSSSRNGFPADNDLYTMDAAGTNQLRISSLDRDEAYPAWSPDGLKIAYDRNAGMRSDIWVANADGSNAVQLTTNSTDDTRASWNDQATKIVFASDRGNGRGMYDLFTMNANGTNQVNITNTPTVIEDYPSWSPDGTKIAFARDGEIYTMTPSGGSLANLSNTPAVSEAEPDWSPTAGQIVYRTGFNANDEIWKMNANGTGQTNLTNNGSMVDEHPSWSPAGDKIAFTRDAFKNAEIYTINPDGTGATRITNNTVIDAHPSWQPIPGASFATYVRPKGAGPLLTALVPAYRPCKYPNRQHGPPFADGSCYPPKPFSRNLTVGAPDANARATNFSGSFRITPIVGDPGTPADEADIAVNIAMEDVRRKSDLGDYTGQLRARAAYRRVTDRENVFGIGTPVDAATSTDSPWAFTVQCVATADTTVGSNCNLTTSVDALTAGTIKESKRAIYQYGQIEVHDGGPDGNVQTLDNDLFAVQGIYVP